MEVKMETAIEQRCMHSLQSRLETLSRCGYWVENHVGKQEQLKCAFVRSKSDAERNWERKASSKKELFLLSITFRAETKAAMVLTLLLQSIS
jgi:hypothetical protein